MKKLFACMLVVAVMMFASTAMAADIKVNVGAETDFIIDKNLKVDDVKGINVNYSAQRYDIKADVLLGENVRITPKAGLSTAQADTAIGSTSVDLDSGVGFNLGVDAQVDVYKHKYANLALIGGYRLSRVDIDTVKLAVLKIDNPIETILYTHEWEIGAKVYKDLSELNEDIPVTVYVGAVYSDLRGNLDANLSLVDIDTDISAEDNFGLRLGASVAPINGWEASVGLRLIDETAIVAAAKYKF